MNKVIFYRKEKTRWICSIIKDILDIHSPSK